MVALSNNPHADNSSDETLNGCGAQHAGAGVLVSLVRMSLQGMLSNRTQFTLTVLTMSIGALTMALTFFLGQGALARVWDDVEKMMGSWAIAYADLGVDRRNLDARAHAEFTEEDMSYVRAHVTDTRLICPIYMGAQAVENDTTSIVIPVDGVVSDLEKEPMFSAIQGTALSEGAHRGLAWECLVTESAQKTLDINIDAQPLLLVGKQPFRVVGVTPDPPQVDSRFQARVILPYESARILWVPSGTVGHLLVAWSRTELMEKVVTDLRQVLDCRHGVNTYYLSSSLFSIKRSKAILANFMVIGAAQALFCILVASIGVMNVMLTNVTRRAHEFAVRLVMGSRREEILTAVVVEGVLTGLVGAGIGIALAYGTAPYVGSMLAAKIPGAEMLQPTFCREGLLYPFLVCGFSSLLAGIVPAMRVWRMDVLVALREKV